MLRMICAARLALGMVVIAVVGCTTQTMTISSNPDHAAVTVNGSPIGETPVKYTFDYGQRTYYDVMVRKPGFLEMSQQLIGDTDAAHRPTLDFDLPPDPAYRETTASQATNQWLKIPVSEKMSREAMWQTLVDAVTSRYSNIEQLDNSSGYIRSVPITKTYKHPGQGDYMIRTQFLGSLSSTQPLVYKIKIQSEMSDHPGQWQPFDRIFGGDEQLVDELQSRLETK